MGGEPDGPHFVPIQRAIALRPCTVNYGIPRGNGGETGYMEAGERMAGAVNKRVTPPGGGKQMEKKGSSDWTSGLKRLYDSVVEEPIPDAFKDLLAKLNDGKHEQG